MTDNHIWHIERGCSFLNNKRLPTFNCNDELFTRFDSINETENLNEAISDLVAILRNYQSALICLDCGSNEQKVSFRALSDKLLENIGTFHNKAEETQKRIWEELQGNMKALLKVLESNDYSQLERRKGTLLADIDKCLASYKSNDQVYAHSFFSDFSRISFSSAFRRLQDKAQVFPLEKYDYARTRLTHTIEVTSIAMQIANLSAQILSKDDNRKKKEFAFLFEKCLNCSALLHDVGNPPFGHFGENAIKDFFSENWDDFTINVYNKDKVVRRKIKKLKTGELTVEQKEQMRDDFIAFDGNAQSLRVAAKIQQYKVGQPLNLTAAVLGSIIKYPCSSSQNKKKQKFGYFYSERDTIDLLAKMGVYEPRIRNPLAMLLEAADDISYVTSELDDAVKKRVLTYELFYSELVNSLDNSDAYCVQFRTNFKKYYSENMKLNISSPFEYTIQRMTNDLRIALIHEAVKAFCSQRNAIFEKGVYYKKQGKGAGAIGAPPVGAYLLKDGTTTEETTEILDCTPAAKLIKWIRSSLFAKYIYKDLDILHNELAGHKVISFLLEGFTEAVLSLDFNLDRDGNYILWNRDMGEKNLFKQEKVFELISKNFVDLFKKETKDVLPDSFEHIYYRLRLVVDYVSGMTDFYALEIYKILQGL